MAFRDPITTFPTSALEGLIESDQIVAELIGKIITGALIRTAAAGQRWELDSTPANEIIGFTGLIDELNPASIRILGRFLEIFAPSFQAFGTQAVIGMAGKTPTENSSITLDADQGFIGPVHWGPLANSTVIVDNPISAPSFLPTQEVKDSLVVGKTAFTFSAVAAVVQTITFPVGHFTVAPSFVGTVQTGVQKLICTLALAPTSANASVRVATADNIAITGTVQLNWMASAGA